MMRPSFYRQYKSALITLSLFLLLNAAAAHAQTTSFTYQGRLSDGGTPANGNYDLQFALWDSSSGGTQIGATQTVPTVPVSAGIFTVQLDFGANAFPGAHRFLEISTRLSGTASFTTLSPRQQITSTPYAIRSLNASSADAVTVSGVPSGSGNYIQNATTPQASANFNISGNGTAGSMSVNGAVSLGGISPPAPAPAGQGRMYFDTSSNKMKVSENGAAFVNLTGGVIGSGTTNSIPLWSAGTTLGNSLITQSGLSVQLPNNVSLAVGAQGNQVQFGSPNGETGMTISGINGRADLRFDGNFLKLVAGPAGGIPLATNGINITTEGNVGIGLQPVGGTKLSITADNPLAATTAVNAEGFIGILASTNSPGGIALISAGPFQLVQLGSGGDTPLCRISANNLVGTCGSSLRYKTDLQPFGGGLNIINRLRPITFKWKSNKTLDVGLGAEDVAEVEPLFITHNDKGEVEGVKYDRLSVVFVNAFKEQQAQIQEQEKQITALKKLVCRSHRRARVCK